jgi:hypothetical protein
MYFGHGGQFEELVGLNISLRFILSPAVPRTA